MQYPHFHLHYPIFTERYGETFGSIAEAASAVLLLPSILFNLMGGSGVFSHPDYGVMGSEKKLYYAQSVHGL